MNDDLKTAFAILERRGETAGAETVAARAIAEAATKARPRSRRSSLMIAMGIAASVVVLAGLVYVRSEAGRLRRIDVSSSLTEGGATDYGPMNLLIVGSDTGDTDSATGAAGSGTTAQVTRPRADLVMVVRLYPSARRATLVSIPRDLWVNIPSNGRDDRLSNAFGHGPADLIAALRARLGIDVNHYVGVDFAGFRELVSIAGGVRMPFAAPARDAVSGLDVPAGCVSLDGEQALAFARSRHLETLEGGKWLVDPTGDLGRIQRQQLLVRQLIVRIGTVGVGKPVTASRLVRALVTHTVVDSGLSATTLLRLTNDFRDVGPDAIAMLTLPTTPVSVAGAAVLQVDESGAAAVRAALAGDGARSPTHDAATTESPPLLGALQNCT